jgi:hypothetical protein
MSNHDPRKANSLEDPMSRRTATAGLLKAFGAAALLDAACAGGVDEVAVRRFSAEIAPTNLLVTDFVTDLRTVARGTRTVAIVFAFSTTGDGGGGLFTWQSGTNPWPDDCLYINAPGGGYWKRMWAGELNVRWFGAKGDDTTDDMVAIQKGLDALAFHRGGVLVFPVGVYLVSSSLQIPRRGHNCDRSTPITLRGMGVWDVLSDGGNLPGCSLVGPVTRNGSILHFTTSGPATSPVVSWRTEDPSENACNAVCCIEGLGFVRSGSAGGAILKHAGGVQQRLIHSLIRDCYFYAAPSAGEDYALVDIQWPYRTTLENVRFDGGENGLRFRDGGHLTIRSCGTTYKADINSHPLNKVGINIFHCGPVIIQNTRFEGATVAHIKVDSFADRPAGPLSIEGLTTEGGPPFSGGDDINLQNTVAVKISNSDISARLMIGTGCRDVQLTNIDFSGALQIADMVRHVHGEGLVDVTPLSTDPLPRFIIGANVKDVKLLMHKVDTGETYPFPVAAGLESTGVIVNGGDTLQVQGLGLATFAGSGDDLFRVTASPLRYIQNGFQNQVITISMIGSMFGNGSSPPAGHSPIQLRGNVSGLASVEPGSVIQFMYRTGKWYELGR